MAGSLAVPCSAAPPRSDYTIPALAGLTARAGSGRASAAVLNAFQDDPASGTKGGVLKVATIGEAPHLDEHQSTAGIIAVIGVLRLRGRSSPTTPTYQAIPELVAEHTVSEDGMTHTMKLRQGVMFHNGEEMKAADAIASVQRWGRISGVGKRLMEKTTEHRPGRRLHARVEAHASRTARS